MGVANKVTYPQSISLSSGGIYVGGFTNRGVDGQALIVTQDSFVTKYDSAATRPEPK